MHRNKKLDKTDKELLRKHKTVINGVYIAIKKQLMLVQHEITAIIGRPLQQAHLLVRNIDVSTAEIVKIEAKGRILTFISPFHLAITFHPFSVTIQAGQCPPNPN